MFGSRSARRGVDFRDGSLYARTERIGEHSFVWTVEVGLACELVSSSVTMRYARPRGGLLWDQEH